MAWQSNLLVAGFTGAAVTVGAMGMNQLANTNNQYLPDQALPDVDVIEDAGLSAGSITQAIEQSDINQAVVYSYANGDYAVRPSMKQTVQSEQDTNTNLGNANDITRPDVKVSGLGTVQFGDGTKADQSLMSEASNMQFSPNTILSEYESAYPTGTVWTNNFYYENQNKDIYRGGYGCAGFAYMLSDAIYGDAHTVLTDDVFQITPYCVVELYDNQHTAFVLSVDENAGEICVAEANVSGGNIVWGSYYSFTDVSGVLVRLGN